MNHTPRCPAALALAAFACSAFVQPALGAAATPPGFPPFSPKEYTSAGLSPQEPHIEVNYPGAAANRGLAKGSAVVSVLVGGDGKMIDSLAIAYTDKLFGTALLEKLPTVAFQAANFQGTPVPARFDVGFIFEARQVSMTAMDEAKRMFGDKQGAKFTYEPVPEHKLDHPLELQNPTLPLLPVGYTTTGDQPVKVFVTFYVDEEGHARIPNVESAASPRLIPGAIKAVRMWTFTPPTLNGQPVLVFAGRAVGFLPRPPAAGTSGAQ